MVAIMKCNKCEMLGLSSVVMRGSTTSTLVHYNESWKDGAPVGNRGVNIERTDYSCSNGHKFTHGEIPIDTNNDIKDEDLINYLVHKGVQIPFDRIKIALKEGGKTVNEGYVKLSDIILEANRSEELKKLFCEFLSASFHRDGIKVLGWTVDSDDSGRFIKVSSELSE